MRPRAAPHCRLRARGVLLIAPAGTCAACPAGASRMGDTLRGAAPAPGWFCALQLELAEVCMAREGSGCCLCPSSLPMGESGCEEAEIIHGVVSILSACEHTLDSSRSHLAAADKVTQSKRNASNRHFSIFQNKAFSRLCNCDKRRSFNPLFPSGTKEALKCQDFP